MTSLIIKTNDSDHLYILVALSLYSVMQHHLACWLQIIHHFKLFSAFFYLFIYFFLLSVFALCSIFTFLPSIHVVLLCFLLLWVLCAATQEQVGFSVFIL